MARLLILAALCCTRMLSAQGIMWITPCTDKNFCFNAGSCTQGNVFMTEKAVTNCPNSPLINYTYRIDLFNDGSTDIQSSQDTVSGPFPEGTHKVSWRATDNCFNVANCSYLFTIKDCQGPTLLCINSLAQNLDFNCVTTFEYSDFLLNFSDNCTPGNELEFGIREAGLGSGFPAETSLTFDACDLGTHSVEIWVKDENNFTSHCDANLEVQINNNGNACDCLEDAAIQLKGCARTADSTRLLVYAVRAELVGSTPQGAPLTLNTQKTVEDSCFNLLFADLPLDLNYQVAVRARRSGGWTDGVSTFDLLQTSKHILNIQPFQNAYQRLAADVNGSNSVTTFDVVETRKLILGIYDSFPAVPSWRFIRPLANPANLLSAVKDTYLIVLPGLGADTVLTGLNFVGIKMGDTNLSAKFTDDDADDRAPVLFSAEDRFLEAGATAMVPVRLAEKTTLYGWQAAFAADPLRGEIKGMEGLPEEDFHLKDNELRASWFTEQGKTFEAGETVVWLKIEARQPGLLSQMLTLCAQKMKPEVYVPAENGGERRCALWLGFDVQNGNGTLFFPPRPNPFTEETMIELLADRAGKMHLEVFDPAGKKVLEQMAEVEAGYHSLFLQAADLPEAGVYFYRLKVNGEVFSGRVLRR